MQQAAYAAKAGENYLDEIFSYTLSDFPRIAKHREEVLKAVPGVALERSKLLTEYFEKHGFDLEHRFLRQALSLKYILANTKPVVFPNEKIVGSTTEHRLGCVMFPEFQSAYVWPEMLKLPHKKKHPYSVSDEAIDEFSFRIFPYFKEYNIHNWAKEKFGYSDSIKFMERMIFFLVAHPNGVSHLIPNYPIAIEKGLNHVISLARKKRDEAGGDRVKSEFYEAMALTCEGVIEFADNYASKCEELSRTADKPWKNDLLAIAEMLHHVPAEPARTLWEALQSMWIVHVALMFENSDLAMSFGRMDQFLLPYYERDLAEGRLDRKAALELFMDLYVKMNDHTPLIPAAAEALFGGSATNQSITLSGMGRDGKDSTNELSYMMIKALELLKLREPNVDTRFHNGSPSEWYGRVLDVVRSTGAAPALYNDEAIVRALESKGASLEDARDYGVIGCVETTVQGKVYGMTGSILLNLAAVLELTVHNGFHTMSSSQIGPKTGYLRDMKSYDEFWNAFVQQVNFMVGNTVDAEISYEKAHEDLHPIPLLSALIEGPMESGKDLTSGGAKYNSSGVWVVGLADVTDSLAALKTLVFEENRISPSEMQDALDANFVGYDKVRAACLNRAPKYGNDDPAADEIAVKLVEIVDNSFGRFRNYRGGPYHVGYWTITFHSGYGKITGSLPNGRAKGQSLASGATPVSGVARKGPSASLSSSAKLPAEGMANCIALNHKIPASLLKEPGKMQVLEQLVRGYFKKRGMQLQFVIADKNMLIEAMNRPELAKDLLVRVSGYTAYFGDLDKAMQMEIINRTEDEI